MTEPLSYTLEPVCIKYLVPRRTPADGGFLTTQIFIMSCAGPSLSVPPYWLLEVMGTTLARASCCPLMVHWVQWVFCSSHPCPLKLYEGSQYSIY